MDVGIPKRLKFCFRGHFAGLPILPGKNNENILVFWRLLPRLETLASDLSGDPGDLGDFFFAIEMRHSWGCSGIRAGIKEIQRVPGPSGFLGMSMDEHPRDLSFLTENQGYRVFTHIHIVVNFVQ